MVWTDPTPAPPAPSFLALQLITNKAGILTNLASTRNWTTLPQNKEIDAFVTFIIGLSFYENGAVYNIIIKAPVVYRSTGPGHSHVPPHM